MQKRNQKAYLCTRSDRGATHKKDGEIRKYFEDKEEGRTMVFLDSKKFIDVMEKHNRNVFKKTGNKIVEVRK